MPVRSVDGPPRLAVIVLRRPDLVADLDGDRPVHDHRGRRIAVVERRRVDDRLERRARLAIGLRGAVELRLRIGEAADHGEHAAGMRVHRHQRRRTLPAAGAACSRRRLPSSSTKTTSPGFSTSAGDFALTRLPSTTWRMAKLMSSLAIVPVSRSADDAARRPRASAASRSSGRHRSFRAPRQAAIRARRRGP